MARENRLAEWRRIVAAATLLLLAAGCSEQPTIATYTTPANESRARRDTVDQARGSLNHMLAAIVPDGEQAWFFKIVTSASQVEPLRGPFRDFIASVDVTEGDGRPGWTLPDGWVEKPGDAIRAATIAIPLADGTPLELTVATLPLQGEWAPYVAANVNRWMGQLQQDALAEATVMKLAQNTPTKSGDAAVFELVGVMQATPGMMPAGHPPVGPGMSAATAGAKTGPGVTERSNERAADAPPSPPSAEFTYTLPPGWAVAAGNPMRKATFAVEADGQVAQTAVTTFPATPGMVDPLENARRWAGGVGAPLDDASLQKAIEETTIGGLPGQVMAFSGPADAPTAKAVVAGMVRRGDVIWFFKFDGPAALVTAQTPAFRELLGSIRFAE